MGSKLPNPGIAGRGVRPGGAGAPLTSADALQGGGAGPEVALQPLGVVAGLRSAAVLVQLLGADLAAAAAVRHQPHARGALRRGRRALAHGGAGRAQSLRSGAERPVSAGSREEPPDPRPLPPVPGARQDPRHLPGGPGRGERPPERAGCPRSPCPAPVQREP